ncbi:hypothetical protein KP509_12G010400 [Ceratopteris richardii]|uniref:THH1/TOM1/TOM3 domain-containing protein n=1 Tax=Ceratopteris richardii TaxID=49495 RepID=A0A8T2TIL7_CERRI|nr:hypothetical protein KP509_12G010400 [Ceratopteris richardii]
MDSITSSVIHADFQVLNILRDLWAINSSVLEASLFFTLCGAYSLVALFAVVQLIRIQLRASEYGWTTQKVFHFMNFIVNAARAFVFGFYSDVYSFKTQIFTVILLEFPGLLFFSTYTLLVLFWAEIYNQATSLPTENLRPGFLAINGAMYFIQIVIWLGECLSYNAVTRAIVKLFFAVVSCSAAFGFALYGGRLFRLIRSFHSESRGRRSKLLEIGLISSICFICFMVRTIVVAFSAFDEKVDLDVLNHPILNFLYFMIFEVLPSALVLFILRKLPPKRTSQYHPIR